jgi:hypothetical protein
MDLARRAREIYFATKDDASYSAVIRTELETLGKAILANPAASQTIVSSTVNGQTFTAQPGITQMQRLTLLRLVLAMRENGGAISSTSRAYL